MSTWIDCLFKATQEAETPKNYIYWAGIASISAVVGPNVFFNRGGVYKLSPNLFVMLIGESGLGKGLPIWIAKKLVYEVGNTRVIEGRNTIAAIIQELATTETDKETGKPRFKDARGFVISGEFKNLLQRDEQALTILTEWYDTHYMETWKDKTKHSGKSALENLNITIFGGSTPQHFKTAVPDSDIEGGFVGRILTVYEETRSRINALENEAAENQLIRSIPALSEHLKTLALIRGPFRWANETCKEQWVTWYTDIRNKKVYDPTGAVNRLPDNVLKVAMCISLSKDVELIIRPDDLDEAIEKCMTLTIDSRRLTGGRGKGTGSEGAHLVLQLLYRAEGHQLLKRDVLKRNYGAFDVYELDRILATLEAADYIVVRDTKAGPNIIMPESIVTVLQTLMERDK